VPDAYGILEAFLSQIFECPFLAIKLGLLFVTVYRPQPREFWHGLGAVFGVMLDA